MSIEGIFSGVFGSCVVLALGLACADESDRTGPAGGSSGRDFEPSAGSSQGGSVLGSAGQPGSSSAGTSNAGNAGSPDGTAGAGGAGGSAGAEANDNGAGEAPLGGQAGAAHGLGGEGGGGDPTDACEATRNTLLGPVDRVSTELVTVQSETEGTVVIVVDASAGGYLAAGTNPYIYLSLSQNSRVDVSDVQADYSTEWDVAFKRDIIRSNGGDSGPASAEVAALVGADFDAVTASDATDAPFARDRFVAPDTCQPIADEVGKPLTAFAGWYDYAPASMTLTPSDRVYLVRAADGSTLYKLKITGYYLDVPDGIGGTVKKSAVYSLVYRAL